MEENKPRRVDFHCGVTGERCVSGRDDDGAASGIQCGEPLGAGAGDWAGHRRLAGLIVKNIRYEQPGVAVNAGEIHLAVGLDCLWRSSLCVNDLALKTLMSLSTAKMPPSEPAQEEEESGPLNLSTPGPSRCRAWR